MGKKKECLQFFIESEANRQLALVSEKLGVSKAELVREGVNKILKEKLPVKEDPAYKIAGLIDEKMAEKDIAAKHDYYLYGEGRKKGK